MMSKNKILEILNSRNFLVSIISIILLGFSANGVSTEDIGGTAEQLYDLFFGKHGSELIITVVLYVINSGSRIFTKLRNKKFDWSFIKNSNTQAAFLSLLSVIIGFVTKEPMAGYVTAIVTQILNIIYQVVLPAKTKE